MSTVPSDDSLLYGKSVYLLDDDPIFSNLLSFQLTQRGIFTKAWTSVFRFLDTLSHTVGLPDIFIIDFHFGTATDNGLTVCRSLYALYRRPTMVLSGDNSPSNVISCLDAGASQYLRKPCHVDAVMAHLRAMLRDQTVRPVRDVRHDTRPGKPTANAIRRSTGTGWATSATLM